MEIKKKEKVEYNIFDFLVEEATGYPSIYEILGKYIPELKGDYSTANLINSFLDAAESNNSRKFVEKKYIVSFDELSQMLMVACKDSSKQLTAKEKIDILVKLNESTSGLYECSNFTTIEEFVKYAKENLDNENSKPLRDEIINAAVYIANKKITKEDKTKGYISPENYRKVQQLKFELVQMYIAWSVNHVAAKYDQFLRARENIEEWDIIESIRGKLSKKDIFDAYDKMYTNYVEKTHSYNVKTAIESSYQAKREQIVMEHLEKALTSEEKNEVNLKGWGTVLGHRRSGSTVPEEGSIDWYYEAYEKPILICDTIVKYSPNGDDYQRVVMISYGKFHYNDGLFDSSIVQSELVGISRVGKDNIYDYSKIIPLDTISFRETSNIKQGEGTVEFKGKDGKGIDIIDDKTKNILYGFHTRKIPEYFRYSFAADFTSDMRLQILEEHGIEFLGMIQKNGSVIRFENEDLSGAEANAVAYACKYPQHNLKGKETLRQVKASIKDLHLRLTNAAILGKFDKAVEKEHARVGFLDRDTGTTTYSKDPIEIEGDELI